MFGERKIQETKKKNFSVIFSVFTFAVSSIFRWKFCHIRLFPKIKKKKEINKKIADFLISSSLNYPDLCQFFNALKKRTNLIKKVHFFIEKTSLNAQ